ncbi:MAG TPA: cobalamin-dependent protein [Myxococcota bacterium]|nr:cobalamin-dependent protein [Myxococcota bacterium]HRY92027.1 cobalamin-dependent protein [Myxococcota bacterium]HSA21074.1 cobalamin-dependent protein [Myxococcota bacterium]
MARVLLVNANPETAPYPVPPLGLCLAAEALAGAPEAHEVRVLDGTFAPPGALEEAVRAFAPEVIGLGVRNVDDVVMEGGRHYVAEIRARFVEPLAACSRAPRVLGGAGFSLYPEALLDALDADCGLVGEAEAGLPALVAALVAGRSPADLPGVVTRGPPPGRRVEPARLPGAELRLPPARIERWLDYAPYRERGSYPVQTKRGCAHDCLYCSYVRIEGGRYRLRAPGLVADEIARACQALGDPPPAFEIVDSTFNDPPGHAEEVCRAIAARGLGVRLRTMGVNPGQVSASLLALMRRAGFAQVDCTPDSASPRMLAALHKNFDRPALERAAAELRRADMPTMWFFLLGGPGEDEASLAETFDFVDRCVDPADMVHLTAGLRIYPRTGLHRAALAEGLVAPDDPLLAARFYVSPRLGAARLRELVARAAETRPNCVPAWEATPPADMLREAAALRARDGLQEPMFRTLLRLRRARMRRA